MKTPNVLVRTHYFETGSDRRAFYSSNQKDDYLGYVDKGIKSDSAIDYMDYSGNPEKSSGLFSSNGLLSEPEKKELRERLRATKSCVWDTVISFETEYGKRNVYDYKQAVEMLNRTLPGYLESIGIDKDNVTWYTGLHTNTDNRHIHLSFFENEPRIYDKRTKGYRYRRGKLDMGKVKDFKMSIEKHFLTPIEGIKRLRKMATDQARRQVTGAEENDEPAFRQIVRELYDEIPMSGSIAYESANMDGCRKKVDELTRFVLAGPTMSYAYKLLLEQMEERDKKIREICEKQKIDDPTKYLYVSKFQNDLRRRMGNAAIKAIVEARKGELLKSLGLRHPKAKVKLHTDSVIGLLAHTAELSERVSDEALDSFEEFERSMKKAEYERLLEEGEIEAE
jgi:hypothetical protein